MAEIAIIQNGSKQSIPAEKGAILATVLNESGFPIDMPCGGKGTCGKCLVQAAGELCLACQKVISGDLEVELGEVKTFDHILTGGLTGLTAAENPLRTEWGASVDIGTTTICVALIGKEGESGTVTRKNPQAAMGADVISRIEKSLEGKSADLAAVIQKTLCEMFGELAVQAGIPSEEIDAVVLTGNTTMLYLLTGQNPRALSRAPFRADRLFGEYISADSLKLGIAKKAKVYLPRCISAFVGADVTTALLASGMCDKRETALLADIGTNGEIALWHKQRLYSTSTAAGPAFEGGGISRGVYGVRGAIDRVWTENGQVCASTIGGAPAIGICGSGVVDAVAVMLSLDIIDERGAFTISSDFELLNGVAVTQGDVRQLQLAKGSVRAGMETLLEIAGVAKQELDALYIAGGFGNYLDLGNAAAIGLIPRELLSVARCIGNAAHIGASMLLQNESLVEKALKLAKNAETVALETNPVFTHHFMNCMMFE